MTEATTDLGTAAAALADVLEQENRLLAALDLAGAAAMLAAKQQAATAFTDAVALARKAPSSSPAQRQLLTDIGQRLGRLANDNRKLLERGMAAQNRVMAVFARAARTTPAVGARYGARGTLRAAARPQAMAVFTRI